MILTFSLFHDKIMNGEKDQTLRRYNPNRWKQLNGCWNMYQRLLNDGHWDTWFNNKYTTQGKLQLYWHNPRNGGTAMFDTVMSEKPFLVGLQPQGFILVDSNNVLLKVLMEMESREIAKRDGFDTYYELRNHFIKELGFGAITSPIMCVRWDPKQRSTDTREKERG